MLALSMVMYRWATMGALLACTVSASNSRACRCCSRRARMLLLLPLMSQYKLVVVTRWEADRSRMVPCYDSYGRDTHAAHTNERTNEWTNASVFCSSHIHK